MTSISETMDDEPLTFKNYNATFYRCFAEMFNKKELSDAILVCDNNRVHVHKFLLSASSPFFNSMFKKAQNNNLNIMNVKYEDLLRVLDYIYKGQVALHPDKVSSFLDATKKLSVTVDSGELQKLVGISALSVKLSKPRERNSNIDVGEVNCDQSSVKKINPKTAESSKIEKHNLSEEMAKMKILGVIEVTREEFFKRMFRAHAIPWPGDEIGQTSQASTPSVGTSTAKSFTAQPSTSSQSLPALKSQNPIEDKHSSSKVPAKPNPKPKSPPNSALSNMKTITEIQRLIKERLRNIEGLQNKIKMLAKNGINHRKERRELKVHENGLAHLQKLLP